MKLDYWYHSQFRRHILHFGRLFSNFKIGTYSDDGNLEERDVPCRYLGSARDAEHILRGNSENRLNTAPIITYVIDTVEYPRSRAQNPIEKDQVIINEREFDEETGTYLPGRGNSYQVTRINPAPVDIIWRVFIITDSEEHKFQLAEQIYPLFHQPIQMQLSVSPVDWTSRIHLELQSINWTSRSVPLGTDESLDVCDMTFRMESWINLPAIINKQTLIKKVVSNINIGSGEVDDFYSWDFSDNSFVYVTPGNHDVRINEDYTIDLLGPNSGKTDVTWKTLIERHGKYDPDNTLFHLRAFVDSPEDRSKDAIGRVVIDPNNPQKLLWTIDVDTLPNDTQSPVRGIVDPFEIFPGNGLPAVNSGDRYIILQSLSNNPAWGGLTASENSIIEYDGNDWFVDFEPNDTIEFVTSIKSGKKFIFTPEDGWHDPIVGIWYNQWWSLKIVDVN